MNATAVTTKTQRALTFGSHEIKAVARDGQIWMSSSELRQALEYADEKAIHRIYSSHADEFTATMTKVIKVATASGKQAVRFFSLRGAHLLAMFARTPVAKAFRVWVLDILDREVEQMRSEAKSRTSIDKMMLEELAGLCNEVQHIGSWWRKFGGAIEIVNPKLHGLIYEQFLFAPGRARAISRQLGIRLLPKDYYNAIPWDGSSQDRMAHYRKFQGGGAA